MKRVAYVDLLERLRQRDHADARDAGPLDGIVLPRRRDATKRLEVRVTPEQRAFVRAAAEAARSNAVDESAVVAAGLAILDELDLPWANIVSRDDLMDAVRRRLREKC